MAQKKTDKTNRRLTAIDGMKGIGACIIAFFWHYQHFKPQNGSPFFSIFPVSYKSGYLMVELFFMLSGFGMMLGYSERVTGRLIGFREYITKRLKKGRLQLITTSVGACFTAMVLQPIPSRH